ncbi:37259_t:CDS:1, partial [Gigaspora margarita]
PTTQYHINDVKTTIPKSITKNSNTKGNDVNDKLSVHNAINCSKNDCSVMTTTTKNYDAKNNDT